MTHGPSFVYFKLFDDCNARCNMCDCWINHTRRRDPAHYIDQLDKLMSSEFREVRFTGGEPLLYKDLASLIEHVVRNGRIASVISNGWLLPARLDEIADAGVSEVILSIDGPRPIHDEIRGLVGLFDRCVDSMSRVRNAGLSLGINTVLQARNIQHIYDLSRLIVRAHAAAPSWWHLIPVRDNVELSPSAFQVVEFVDLLPRIRASVLAAGTVLIADVEMFRGGLSPCHVPRDIAFVDGQSGLVYGCNMLAYGDEPVGDLSSVTMADISSTSAFTDLINKCANGKNSACGRCDSSSRAMNTMFIRRVDVRRSSS